MILPKYVVLQSVATNKYVHYNKAKDEGSSDEWAAHLLPTGEEVVSPFAKMEIEKSKVEKGLVHLRCCYNNKYWSSSRSYTENGVVAAQSEPEENLSDRMSTLFRLETNVEGDPDKIRIFHVHLERWVSSYAYDDKLILDFNGQDDVFKVINWETLLILPKYIGFKGDNGSFLQAISWNGHKYLQFGASDHEEHGVLNQVVTNSDGSVRIMNPRYGMFWRNAGNWIKVDSSDTSGKDRDTLFWPVKIEENRVALRSMGNNLFCKRLSTDGKDNCLNAAMKHISKEAKFEVKEMVRSRSIYDVEFHLKDARIYDERVLTMASTTAINQGSQPAQKTLRFKYAKREEKSWNSSVSIKLGLEVNFKAGVPMVAEEGIKITTEIETGYEWGAKKETEIEIESEDEVNVPPMTKVTVRLIATTSKCDVPFSYTQCDTLFDGTQVIQEMHDGVFTGVSSYNFQTEIMKEVPLSQGVGGLVGGLIHGAEEAVTAPFKMFEKDEPRPSSRRSDSDNKHGHRRR